MQNTGVDVVGSSGVPFAKHSTDIFDVYVAGAGAPAERDIDRIITERMHAVQEISSYLGVQLQHRITMVFYPDGELKRQDTGHTGNGWAFGTTLVEIYNETTRVNPYHELTHILAAQIGNPPALFNEGLATGLSELLGQSVGKTPVDQRVTELAPELWPLEELFTFREIGSLYSRPKVAYPQSASVVKYLIHEYGIDKFLTAYRQLGYPVNTETQSANLAVFESVFGRKLVAVEAEWKQRVLGRIPA